MIGEAVGNYRVLKKLGEGGMGAVYLAEHASIGRKAAVKVLLPQFSSHPEIVQRFFNEARTTGLIRHPGLVDIFDFGQLSNGSAYLAMEFLDGESLAARLARERKLPVQLLLAFGRQVASAVGAAHERKIIHRDLKPDNIFLTPDADMPFGIRVKVLDFGIAKLTDDPASSVRTRTSMVMGTPPYMSPEQCRGAGQVDHRSDIYSLGCILFEMACGRTPFVAEGSGELMGAHLRDAPPLPQSFNPDLPEPVSQLVLRTLEKSPGARPQTMAELVREIDSARRPQSPDVARARSLTVESPSQAQDRATSLKPITTMQGAAAEIVATPAPMRSKSANVLLATIAAMFVAVLSLIAVFGWKLFGSIGTSPIAGVSQPTTRSVQPLQSEQPAVAQAQPRQAVQPTVPQPQRVSISIESSPSGAEVFRLSDGVLVGRTPFAESIEASTGVLPFVLKHSGYQDERVELSAERGGTRLVALRSRKATKIPAQPPQTSKREPEKPKRTVEVDNPF